jgi:hypothetical protein
VAEAEAEAEAGWRRRSGGGGREGTPEAEVGSGVLEKSFGVGNRRAIWSVALFYSHRLSFEAIFHPEFI